MEEQELETGLTSTAAPDGAATIVKGSMGSKH